MQNVSCPGCGAPVQFRSHASVMAVCGFCKTTVLKDADSVRDLGKMSAVLDDYSPLQVGSAGAYRGRAFTLVGRIQLRYPAGMWNEWYVLFDDGRSGWLSDASGQYALTTEHQPAHDAGAPLPAFAELAPGRAWVIDGKSYTVGDVREARCTGGQGELPFKVGPGWQSRLADLHSGSSFLTLDYADAGAAPDFQREAVGPTVYTGQAVTLEELKFQLLRDSDQITDSSGKFKGKIDRLECPSCGSNVSYLPGLTPTIVCPSCHTQLDTSGPQAQVLAAGERMAAIHSTLELGARANIGGKQHDLIGLMRRCDEEDSEWTEYLLHSPGTGFLWLVETDEGWFRSKVQDDWPRWSEGGPATLGNRVFGMTGDYRARVTFAAGAFNWRVNAGDSTRIIEFENGKTTLAAEMTAEELTWSQSNPVPADQIRAWFGDQIEADKRPPEAPLGPMSRKFMLLFLAINAIPLLLSFGRTWFYVLVGVLALYLPARFSGSSDEGES